MEDLNSDSRSSFEEAAEKRGYSPKKSRNMGLNHVTHVLKAKGKEGKAVELKFDLKKIKNKKQSQDWLWVEFKNSEGRFGWVHGEADFVAFERQEDFLLVNRRELLGWLNSGKKIRYDLPFVSLAKQAKYRIYKRAGKKEEITQIHAEDLKGLESYKVWKK